MGAQAGGQDSIRSELKPLADPITTWTDECTALIGP